MHTITTTIRVVLALVILLATNLPARAGAQTGPRLAPQSIDPRQEIAGEVQTFPDGPTETPGPVYLPLVYKSIPNPVEIVLNAAWVGNSAGAQTSFLTGSPIRYVVSGVNQSSHAGDVHLTWTVTSACTTSVIYSSTLTLGPGAWEHTVNSTVPPCRGISIATVDVTSGIQVDSLSTHFVAFPPSSVVISNQQAFDICTLPTVAQMQNWWTNSPYDVFNIYLGGAAFACRNNPLDTYWLDAVSQQGWSFILTWVGPQAPCSNFLVRMSDNASTAYQQGRSEADQAFAAASQLGILDDRIIYYDMEAYPNQSACRTTVDEFMRGWTLRLHELGAKAGGYGSPCTSYLSDWANNTPPPDDVWIAYWIIPYGYNPNATVWVPNCLSVGLWSVHQRLRQYAGGHSETWGGQSLVIDSNVLDGEITALAAPSQEGSSAQLQTTPAPQIEAMELLTPQTGWVRIGDRLLWTDTGGSTWNEIGPGLESPGELLAAAFLDSRTGWLAYRSLLPDGRSDLTILHTLDGGQTWDTSRLPASVDETLPVAGASLDFLDLSTGWLSIELPSGSSFSLGRLFFTQDGGGTWQERTLPLGEPVAFLDAERGWVAGGPSGDLLYHTVDGGRTWQLQTLPGVEAPPGGRWLVDLPQFSSPQQGFLPVTLVSETGSAFALYRTRDGGESWQLASRTELEPGLTPGKGLPFSLDPDGRGWMGSPGTGRLFAASQVSGTFEPLTPLGLPPGILKLDFTTGGAGWALVQEGLCLGDKGSSADPLRCTSQSFLLATQDGGFTWREIAITP